MSQVDPWEKAAECARAIDICLDPNRKAALSNLKHMWMALANQRNFLTQEELAREVEAIGRLQVMFGGADGKQSPSHQLQISKAFAEA